MHYTSDFDLNQVEETLRRGYEKATLAPKGITKTLLEIDSDYRKLRKRHGWLQGGMAALLVLIFIGMVSLCLYGEHRRSAWENPVAVSGLVTFFAVLVSWVPIENRWMKTRRQMSRPIDQFIQDLDDLKVEFLFKHQVFSGVDVDFSGISGDDSIPTVASVYDDYRKLAQVLVAKEAVVEKKRYDNSVPSASVTSAGREVTGWWLQAVSMRRVASKFDLDLDADAPTVSEASVVGQIL